MVFFLEKFLTPRLVLALACLAAAVFFFLASTWQARATSQYRKTK